MELDGKNALITGGSVRIGRALTLALAEAGCNVFIHYGKSASQARQTQADAAALGVEAHLHSADLASSQATQGIIPVAVERLGRIDILINNAAIFPETDTFSSVDLDHWEELFNVNLRAPFLLCQAFARQVSDDGNGRIINVLDARVRRPAPDHFVYRLTKSALWQMTEMMAHELAPRITVNAVALGAILPPPGASPDYLDDLAQTEIPLRRTGSEKIVAESVIYLLRQEFLTGATLPIDGGQYL